MPVATMKRLPVAQNFLSELYPKYWIQRLVLHGSGLKNSEPCDGEIDLEISGQYQRGTA